MQRQNKVRTFELATLNNRIMSQHNCLFILPCLFFLLDSLFFSQQDYQLYLFDKALLELLKVIKKSTNGLKNLCLQLFNIFSPIFCAAQTCQTNRPPWWNCQLFGCREAKMLKLIFNHPFCLSLPYRPPSSVVFWLRELCLVHEAECTIMLQSKPIGGAADAPVNTTYNQTHLGNFWAGNSKDTIRAIQSRAHAISAVFAKLCK